MWKKIAPLLIVLSVAMNIAFIGAWAVQVVQAHWFADGTYRGDVWCPLHRELNVTNEQWRQIEPRIVEFRHRSQTICADVNHLRTQLIDLIAADKPDQQAITVKQEEILAGQAQMQQLVVEQLLAEKDVLTTMQQKELFTLLRQRSGCPGRPMMNWSGMNSDALPTAGERSQ